MKNRPYSNYACLLAISTTVVSWVGCSDSENNTSGGILVLAGGEKLAQSGYAYSANPGEDAVFADGWEVRFDRYIVSIKRVDLNEIGNDPTRQDSIGPLVARSSGPWVVDLHKEGPVPGAGAGDTAHPIVTIERPDSGGSFDVTKTYALSFETVAPAQDSKHINLSDADKVISDKMIERQWTHYFSGTATYKGRTATETVDAWAQNYPTTVRFEFGWGSPAKYINCHNPDIGAEDKPGNRGVRPKAAGQTRAQLTFHTDHFFWDTLDQEGTPARFDALAARAQKINGTFVVTMDDLAMVMPGSLRDRTGAPVRDRANQTQKKYEVSSPPPAYSINGVAGIRDLRDFVVYSARSQGHLNSSGLCFVEGGPPDTFAY